jgi:hypothetical protein
MLTATASLGLVYLWDLDIGLNKVDKYLSSEDPMVKVRARTHRHKGARAYRLAADLGGGALGMVNARRGRYWGWA